MKTGPDSSHASGTPSGVWVRTKTIVGEALELRGAARMEYVDRECGADAALRSEVLALLRSYDTAGDALSESGVPGVTLAEALAGAALAQGTMVGRYRIARVLGSGGMGTVFEAHDTSLGRDVALKLLSVGLSSVGARRRFEAEAAALARLDHPGVARVYEAGVHRAPGQALGLPYIAMELVVGAEVLDQFVRRNRADLRGVLEVLARACDAVHHGHQKGVLHRDLKPGNVLVDQGGAPKVIDFGVSRLLGAHQPSQATMAGDLLGTPAYLPPEAFEQGTHALDTRADVYALGATFYEVLAGTPAFGVGGLTPSQAGRIVCGKPPPALGATARDCAGDVETIIAKAMAREPADRYQSAEQLGADLRRVLAFEPILARPAPAWKQVALFTRRHKPLVAAGLLVAAAVALGVTGLAIGLSRARASERRAIEESRRSGQVSAFMTQMIMAASPFDTKEATVSSILAGESWGARAERWPSAAGAGQAPTVGDLLFAASGQLERSFPDDPRLRADMAGMLAVAASEMTDRRTRLIAERAATLLEGAYGLEDPRAIAARLLVSHDAMLNQRSEQRLAVVERDLRVLLAHNDPADAPLVDSLATTYMSMLSALDRTREALPMLREMRALTESGSGADSARAIWLDMELHAIESPQGRPSEALAQLSELLARARALRPASLTAQMHVLQRILDLQRETRDLSGALATLCDGIAVSTALYGGMDAGTYEWWAALFVVALQLGELDMAEYAARTHLASAEAMLGPRSWYTIKASGRLARVLLAKGANLAEAQRAARAAMDGAPEELARGDGWSVYHEVLWAWAIRLQGDPVRARRILVDRAEGTMGPDWLPQPSWLLLPYWAERAQCEMDIAASHPSTLTPGALGQIEWLVREAECHADQIDYEWPSRRMAEQARARCDAMKSAMDR